MTETSYWTEPHPPRERFDSVFALWARAGALFFEGFDYIIGVMLAIGVPAAAVNVAVETQLAKLNGVPHAYLATIPIDIVVSSFFQAWLGGALLYGAAIRLQEGAWPRLSCGLTWLLPRWLRLMGVLSVASLLFTLGLLAFVVPALYLLIKVSLADAAVIYEPSHSAIPRAWELSRYAPLNIFLSICPFFLATMLFTFGVDYDALHQTPILAFAVKWSMLLLLSAFPSLVTALLYGWVRSDEDAAAVARLDK